MCSRKALSRLQQTDPHKGSERSIRLLRDLIRS